MSFGYCGNNNNAVSANLRIDGSGIRFSAAADVVVSIAAGKRKKVTFSVIVPKNVGFSTIPWDTLIASETVDIVSWFEDSALVTQTTSTTLSLWSANAEIVGASALTTYPIRTLFYKFDVKFELINDNPTDTFSAQKLIVGFTYNVPPPNTGHTKFDIYASIVIV